MGSDGNPQSIPAARSPSAGSALNEPPRLPAKMTFGDPMSEKGAFILSLDCEGLWGMADKASVLSARTITQKSLDQAYEQISRILDAAGIRATAAFVSAFAAPEELLRDVVPEMEQLSELEPDWFGELMPRLRKFDRESLDGLGGHAFWKRLAADGHEMGWHGTTHMPLRDSTPGDTVDLELQLAARLNSALGPWPTSVVFPRNQVGHLGRIGKAGFKVYRAGVPRSGTGRVLGLLCEWAVLQGSCKEEPSTSDGLCRLPAGDFLNWPSGARALVPGRITVARWTSMLRDAAARGGYVHMWFHPHNLVTAPAMLETFEAVMRKAGSLVRSGALENMTMAELHLVSTRTMS
jgi:hypothetical protein